MKTGLVLCLLVVTLTWCEGHGNPTLDYSDDAIVANNDDEQGLEGGACPEGFYRRGSSCYHFSHDKETWPGAKVMCVMMKSELAMINDAAENDFIQTQIRLLNRDYYAGGNDIAVLQNWVWAADGEPMLYTAWAPGEPNDVRGEEHCLMARPNTGWNDVPCNEEHYYICEITDKPQEEDMK